jgi:hypothetical protein
LNWLEDFTSVFDITIAGSLKTHSLIYSIATRFGGYSQVCRAGPNDYDQAQMQ